MAMKNISGVVCDENGDMKANGVVVAKLPPNVLVRRI